MTDQEHHMLASLVETAIDSDGALVDMMALTDWIEEVACVKSPLAGWFKRLAEAMRWAIVHDKFPATKPIAWKVVYKGGRWRNFKERLPRPLLGERFAQKQGLVSFITLLAAFEALAEGLERPLDCPPRLAKELGLPVKMP